MNTLEYYIFHLQVTTIAFGIFICLWGLTQFWKCFWEVLKGDHNFPSHSTCPYQAGAAMGCMTGIIFCLTRANTIGLYDFGDAFAGLMFAGGMTTFAGMIGLAMWAREGHNGKTGVLDVARPRKLSAIFAMMLIIILSFILVGLVGTM